jgi:hypothetical protein
MILIKIKDSYVAASSVIQQNPRAFILHLGDDDFVVPSVSRDLTTLDNALENGSPYQINLRPYEDFAIDDQVFQNLVNNSKAGGDTSLVNRILHFVNINVLEVRQDGGAPLTANAILNYTAP